jgi:hypothetical protein
VNNNSTANNKITIRESLRIQGIASRRTSEDRSAWLKRSVASLPEWDMPTDRPVLPIW